MRTYSDDVTEIEQAYCAELEKRLAQVAVEAWQAARPGGFETAWAEAPHLASNRRVRRPDGTWENEWQDPDGKHTGYFDPAVLLVGVRRPDGKLDALLVDYGCHPVTLGLQSLRISADYPGYMKDYLEARRVAGTAMFALAGGGNINPRRCIMVGAEHPRGMGEELGRVVAEAVGKLDPSADGPVCVGSQVWKILSNRPWPKGSGREQGKEIETEIQALRAGDVCLLAIPGELISEYTALFRGAAPLPHVAVVSIANDSVGYLPTDDAIPQGGHEVRFSAGGGIQESLLNHAAKALAKIAD